MTPSTDLHKIAAAIRTEAFQAWQNAPKSAVATALSCVDGNNIQFFCWTIEDFIDHCLTYQVDPASRMPYVCELRQMPAPNLQELLQDKYENDSDWLNDDGDAIFDLPDVSDLQAHLDLRYAAADLGLWFPTKTAFDVDDVAFRAEFERQQALHAGELPEA